MKARIKSGAGIMQDFRLLKWPHCCPPKSEYTGEDYHFKAKDPDMVFDAEWHDSVNGGYWYCIAPGYGENGNYGNGSILVNGFEGIEK
jgi:hypothetical protein